MRKGVALLVVSVGFVACADKAPQSGQNVPVDVPSSTPPAPGQSSNTVFLFSGSYVAAKHELTVRYRAPTSDVWLTDVLPYGTTTDTVDFHTLPGTAQWQGNCGTSTLCGDTQARNHYTTKTITGLRAIFDAIAPASVTAVGAPYVYGTVAAGASSGTVTWYFSDPTNVDFQFTGHADGFIASQTGNATLSPTMASVSLGTISIGQQGANGNATGSGAAVSQTVTDSSTTDATGVLTTGRTGSAEIVIAPGDCTGQTLQPLGTCASGFYLDCRSSSGATVGAKSATFTITDPSSGNGSNSSTITVTGTCATATTGGGAISVFPRNNDFGNVQLQRLSSASFTVRNTGTTPTGPLTVTQTGSVEFTHSGCAGVVLGAPVPSQSCNLNYSLDCSTVNGATLGSKSATATVTDPDSTSTTAKSVTITLSGACVCVATGFGCNTTSDCCTGTCDTADTYTCL